MGYIMLISNLAGQLARSLKHAGSHAFTVVVSDGSRRNKMGGAATAFNVTGTGISTNNPMC